MIASRLSSDGLKRANRDDPFGLALAQVASCARDLEAPQVLRVTTTHSAHASRARGRIGSYGSTFIGLLTSDS